VTASVLLFVAAEQLAGARWLLQRRCILQAAPVQTALHHRWQWRTSPVAAVPFDGQLGARRSPGGISSGLGQGQELEWELARRGKLCTTQLPPERSPPLRERNDLQQPLRQLKPLTGGVALRRMAALATVARVWAESTAPAVGMGGAAGRRARRSLPAMPAVQWPVMARIRRLGPADDPFSGQTFQLAA
jgi:hypothetical protein